jgi:hypothetical protein
MSRPWRRSLLTKPPRSWLQREHSSRVAEPVLVNCPNSLWRVGRSPVPLNFSIITAEDASQARGGNRFDVPGGGVLYAATNPEGAFAETLARFRPTAAMRAIQFEVDEHLMAVGAIPADWRTRRQLVEFGLDDPLPFLDVDQPATHTFLTEVMAEQLDAMHVDNLDVAAIRGADRFLTRAIAEWAYVASDTEGRFLYSGIRYGSRLGPWECWAIFRGAEVIKPRAIAIQKTNPAIANVARAFDLTIH